MINFAFSRSRSLALVLSILLLALTNTAQAGFFSDLGKHINNAFFLNTGASLINKGDTHGFARLTQGIYFNNATSDPDDLKNNHYLASFLLMAARKGESNILKMLLQKGVPVDITNPSSDTALHFSASGGHKATSKILLNNGADLYHKNVLGLTPTAVAIKSKHNDLSLWLLEKVEIDKGCVSPVN